LRRKEIKPVKPCEKEENTDNNSKERVPEHNGQEDFRLFMQTEILKYVIKDGLIRNLTS